MPDKDYEWTPVTGTRARAAIEVITLGVEMFARAMPVDDSTLDNAVMRLFQSREALGLDEAIEYLLDGLADFVDGVDRLENGAPESEDDDD